MPERPDLERFIRAQDGTYERALGELLAGEKRGHWIWFVFPQVFGLSTSAKGQFYSIHDLAEARDYLAHPLLGPRLVECTAAMLSWANERSAVMILDEVDALKFASSMTLFEAAGGDPCFAEALDAFNHGERDQLTLDLFAR